jgi:hypothetical protein
MYKRLSDFIEAKIAVLGGFLALAVFSLWAVSEFVPPLKEFIVAGGFLNVVVFVVLFDILRRVVELKLEGRQSGVQVSANQEEAWPVVQEYIRKHHPKTVDLIEYSSGTVIPLLEEVCRQNSNVSLRVLICHPAKAISDYERGRIEEHLWYLQNKLRGYKNISVRCYQAPASIRGRCFDRDLVCMGWYIYHSERKTPEIQGHLNAMVTGTISTPDGKHLGETFTNAFEALWAHQDTVDGATVNLSLGATSGRPPHVTPDPH